MPAEVQTGMEKQDMKRLLMKSKKEPVNCAIGMGADPSIGLMLLDRIKGSKAVEKELVKAIPDAKNTRFGHAEVDVDDDPKLVKVFINKPVSSMARKLVKTLKGTGFTKVQILLDDGTAVESFEEADGQEGQAPQGEAQPQGVGTAPPPPPPPPQAQAKPDPAELARLLAEQVKRVPGVVAVAPAEKDRLAKLATDANVQLKTGNLTYAGVAIEQLRRALDAAQAQAQPAQPTTGVPPQAPAQPAQAPQQPATGGAVAYAKSRLAWIAARKKVEGDLEKLRSAIVTTYSQDGIAADLEKRYSERVAPVLANLDEKLADKLDEATNATDPQQRTALVAEAKQIMQGYEAYLAGEKIIADLDTNPFVPVAIQQTISATLATLEKTVR